MKTYQLEFTQNTGVDGVQNSGLKASELGFRGAADLPAGAGITEVRPSASGARPEENTVARRLRSACLVAKGKAQSRVTASAKDRPSRRPLENDNLPSSKAARTATSFFNVATG